MMPGLGRAGTSVGASWWGGNARVAQVYVRDRAQAARDYPLTEIYVAFDGGSGHDFWLPHLSAYDTEVPSKVIEKVHTQPFKVMNGPTECIRTLLLRHVRA